MLLTQESKQQATQQRTTAKSSAALTKPNLNPTRYTFAKAGVSAWSMVWFRWGCTASCSWNVRCVGVRGDAWSVMLSPCNTFAKDTINLRIAKLIILSFVSYAIILCFVRVCRIGVWFGFVWSAQLLAVGMYAVLSFGALPCLSCFLRVTHCYAPSSRRTHVARTHGLARMPICRCCVTGTR